jgi:hypothetical protein
MMRLWIGIRRDAHLVGHSNNTLGGCTDSMTSCWFKFTMMLTSWFRFWRGCTSAG